MNKPILNLLTVLIISGIAFSAFSAQAADVKITWKNPDKYRDVDSGNTGKKRFRENTFSALEKHFVKLAKALPESQILEINVTDVDLAGDVHASGMRDIRVIKDLYFPRIKFSYKLVNTEQEIIHHDDENLKDMNFMMGSALKYRNKVLGYEKKMLDDWFKKAFSDYVEK
jgi:hypothetical protein